MSFTHDAIKKALLDGLLSFPVTDFSEDGNFNASSYKERIEWFLSYDISAIFIAGGTGEFFSLSADEYQQVVRIAAQVTKGRLPLVSSVGRSIPEAIEFARIAEREGINALLLMPPYLVGCPSEGLVEYARRIMENTSLPIIYYNRGNGILSAEYIQQLADDCPNLIGIKDGTGDMQELNDTIKTLGDRLVYIGGVPTAEIISEAYLSIGVNTYSSAVFNFAPEFALHFYQCLRKNDQTEVQRLLQEFYIPFVRLRKRNKGYAVSLVKAGVDLVGKGAGDTRPPLMMPTQAERKELKAIITRSQDLLGKNFKPMETVPPKA